jgi:hypothetical protein
MFINDGKTLFGHTGVIISLCILILLLYFSYNKCYINNVDTITHKSRSDTTNDTIILNKSNFNPIINSNKIENFAGIDGGVDTSKLPIPTNVRLLINGGNLTLNFTLTNTKGVKTPTKIMVVLAQYDINKKNTANNKFFLSNEYEITSSVGINELDFQTNLCKLVDGLPKCQYIFKNVDVTDPAGNLFYYKIGISAMYDNDYNTPLINPYNVTSKDKLFTIDTSLDNQNANYNAFLKSLNKSSTKYNVYDTTLSTADGKYEMIKSELGNYPDNLLIDELTIDEYLLSDLVDKTMAQGLINIDVKMAEKE